MVRPYSTWLSAGTLVVQVIFALVLFDVADTPLITGAVSAYVKQPAQVGAETEAETYQLDDRCLAGTARAHEHVQTIAELEIKPS